MVIACFVALVAACGPECEQGVRQTATSPGGAYAATVYVRNCHATSPFMTIVSIDRAGDPFDGDDYVYAVKSNGGVSVEWASDSLLIVRAPKAEVFRRHDRWRAVMVRYEAHELQRTAP